MCFEKVYLLLKSTYLSVRYPFFLPITPLPKCLFEWKNFLGV